MMPFWTSVQGHELAQGDFLPNCFVPVVPNDFALSAQPVMIPVRAKAI
ncbi:MAG TPA: hypothetical protein VG122_13815 [Gemmata sp.]|jgi:hypothetical protein|nr:hypothetical protein [Gemmata sp.]